MRLVLALSVGGCHELHPLSQVPIVGGTTEQLAIAAEGVVAFDAQAAASDVRLRRIAFDDAKPVLGHAGAYGRDEILLLPSLAPEEVPRVLRHELCHALDHTRQLSARHTGSLEAVASHFPESDDYTVDDPLRLGEVFAELCERGPAAAELFRSDCPGTDDELEAAFAWLADEVWVDESFWEGPLAFGEAGLTWAGPAEAVNVAGSTFGDGLGAPFQAVSVFADGTGSVTYLDVTTGDEVVEPVADEDFAFVLEEYVTADLPFGLYASVAGLQRGPGALVVRVDELATGEPRVVGWDGRDLIRSEGPEGCLPGGIDGTMFTADGRVWSGWASEGALTWQELRVGIMP